MKEMLRELCLQDSIPYDGDSYSIFFHDNLYWDEEDEEDKSTFYVAKCSHTYKCTLNIHLRWISAIGENHSNGKIEECNVTLVSFFLYKPRTWLATWKLGFECTQFILLEFS